MVSGPDTDGSILDFPPSKREYGTAHIKQRCLKSSRFILFFSSFILVNEESTNVYSLLTDFS